MSLDYLSEHGEEVWIALKVQPKASRNEIGPVTGSELKIKVTAPPVDSAANEAVLRLITEKLGCARNAVKLHRGGTSRHKIIAVQGMTLAEITQRLGN